MIFRQLINVSIYAYAHRPQLVFWFGGRNFFYLHWAANTVRILTGQSIENKGLLNAQSWLGHHFAPLMG